MPHNARGRGRGISFRLRERLNDCGDSPFDVRVNASDANTTYTLAERCKPKAQGAPARGNVGGQSERQQIISELIALGMGIEAVQGGYGRLFDSIQNDAMGVKKHAEYTSCILDGIAYMKSPVYKRLHPLVTPRMTSFINSWNNAALVNKPTRFKKLLQSQILKLLIA